MTLSFFLDMVGGLGALSMMMSLFLGMVKWVGVISMILSLFWDIVKGSSKAKFAKCPPI